LTQHLKLREEKRWLLSSDDPLCFAVMLLALLQAGKQAVIPPNTRPGTLAALAGAFDARVAPGMLESPSAPAPLAAFDPHAAIIDLYTSGSTGEPKRVRKTLAQFEAEAQVLEALWGTALGSAAIVATAPHQHIYGLLFRLLWPLSAGRAFDTVTCAHPDTLIERIALLGDAALVSSPAQLARLPELVTLSAISHKPKLIFSSGGPLPAASAILFFREFGQAPVEIFGSTETGGIAWRKQQGGADDDSWMPFPGMKIARSDSGALSLSSPFLGSSDCQQRDDAIALLADGRFRLLGRLDRIVKIEEKRLSLPEMESRINQQAWVVASAVVPLGGRRQSLGAVLVLNAEGRQVLEEQGRRTVAQALRQHLSAHFEAVLLPRRWRFPDRLPVNDLGKIEHSALVDLFFRTGDEVLLPEVKGITRQPGDGHQVVLDLHVTPALTHFSGHFPGLPILPGVVQIDWAIKFARQHLPLSGLFSALENVKFLALILPDTRLQLTLTWDSGLQRLDFSFANGQRRYSAGRIVFSGPV
jgi:acyl-CoA synthetase (AMP-forming)/AMP-acid ligase II/3-hydroxymyristoyl/3-hydroxydecanoyl-(acyl carrier protein) dehydratase